MDYTSNLLPGRQSPCPSSSSPASCVRTPPPDLPHGRVSSHRGSVLYRQRREFKHSPLLQLTSTCIQSADLGSSYQPGSTAVFADFSTPLLHALPLSSVSPLPRPFTVPIDPFSVPLSLLVVVVSFLLLLSLLLPLAVPALPLSLPLFVSLPPVLIDLLPFLLFLSLLLLQFLQEEEEYPVLSLYSCIHHGQHSFYRKKEYTVLVTLLRR